MSDTETEKVETLPSTDVQPEEPPRPEEKVADADAVAEAKAEAEPTASEEGSANRPSTRIKIGTQRPEAQQDKPVAEPQVKPTKADANKPAAPTKHYPPPNIRDQLTPDLEQELEAALGGESIDSLMEKSGEQSATEIPEGTRLTGTVTKVYHDNVFVDLGGRNQGVVAVKNFDGKEIPEPPAQLEIVVVRHVSEDGLCELSLPGAAVEVGNWEDVEEGQTVEVAITGSNKGGLECEVSGIRGFMPMGQISIYRVENPEEYIGQRLNAVVTEANRDRKNLVLSHRAVMEREKAENRDKLLAELAPGQIREGVVRSLRDFGAFVDLGGVDGLVHVSKMSWDRVNHPSEVLSEGQVVKVKIEKIDADTGKIGLSYRESAENPWDSVDSKYFVGDKAKGTVSKLMDFGAFVKLEPGVEGLIHISELAHGRVFRTSDVVSEGQAVEVKILGIDKEKQRISLSLTGTAGTS